MSTIAQTTGLRPAVPFGGATPPDAARPTGPSQQAQGFERLMLAQLTKVLADSAFSSEETTSAATTAYRDLLPDALTESLAAAGGIGLAKSIDAALPGGAAS